MKDNKKIMIGVAVFLIGIMIYLQTSTIFAVTPNLDFQVCLNNGGTAQSCSDINPPITDQIHRNLEFIKYRGIFNRHIQCHLVNFNNWSYCFYIHTEGD